MKDSYGQPVYLEIDPGTRTLSTHDDKALNEQVNELCAITQGFKETLGMLQTAHDDMLQEQLKMKPLVNSIDEMQRSLGNIKKDVSRLQRNSTTKKE